MPKASRWTSRYPVLGGIWDENILISERSIGVKLTPKQQRFCNEYLVDLNATQAAIRAGYSQRTAAEIGVENLTKPNIQAEIKRLMDVRGERCQISADLVLERISELAFSNIFPVLKALEDNRLDQLPESVKRTVKALKVKRDKDGTIAEYAIAMHDKIRPLQMLGRHLGMFKDDAEAIAVLTTYGTVTRTEQGFTFEYADS